VIPLAGKKYLHGWLNKVLDPLPKPLDRGLSQAAAAPTLKEIACYSNVIRVAAPAAS
jgi:hypothetical protein